MAMTLKREVGAGSLGKKLLIVVKKLPKMDTSSSSEAELKVATSGEAMETEVDTSGPASGSKPVFKFTYLPKVCRYIHPLTTFPKFPSIDLRLTELDTLVVTRIFLYRALERMGKKLHIERYSPDWLSQLQLELINFGRAQKSQVIERAIERICVLLRPEKQSVTDLKQSVWDESCAHFILRIMYCRKNNLKEYFVAREVEWFRAKWAVLDISDIEIYLQNSGFSRLVKPISDAEKSDLKEKLLSSTAGVTESNFESTDFYKLNWVLCSTLMRKPEVYLERGKAFVPTPLLYSFFETQFKKKLEKSLTHYYDVIIQEGRIPDDRISHFCELYDGELTEKVAYRSRIGGLNGKKIDEAATLHFPLCMQHFHERLREDHHLKHEGRFTYGLFLKEIGLQYEAAEEFFRSEFTQKIDEHRFEKEYLYYIKHLYRMVGGRKNYEARSCEKLIKGLDQHYGCPFKMYDRERLLNKCISQGFSQEEAQAVVDCADKQQYQMACSTYFQVANQKEPKELISHPNQYYNESCKKKEDDPFMPDIEDLFVEQ